MRRLLFSHLAILALVQFMLSITLSSPSLAQEWKYRVEPKGILKVVDLHDPHLSTQMNYAEGLVALDKDNNTVACLAEDWRWLDDRTIEFKLREGVRFHNGERFNAKAVSVNWDAYTRMENPIVVRFANLSDETIFQIADEYTVRFTFPEPDGLALVKFQDFFLFAPAFFTEHKFDEGTWGYLPEAGPWGSGPFELVEGSVSLGKLSDRVVLEAHEDYWDRRYPMVRRVIFDNALIGNRKEAMRLCRETEGTVDLVNFIRPLDTLKVAESVFAKVIKSKDVVICGGTFNQRKKDSKWRDVRLRKAVNYSVNREELLRYCARGNAYNLEGFFIPPGAYGHNPNLTPYTYDTNKARSLLAEADYPNGFGLKIITWESWKLEVQIIKRMLERVGINVELDVLPRHEYLGKVYIPILDKPPEESDWDIMFGDLHDVYGHTGASLLAWPYIESSDFRWIEYDSKYEQMWEKMAMTVDPEVQEEMIRQLVKYNYDNAYSLLVYSPLTLYAVNKQVDFVPQKDMSLRLKETSVNDNHWSIRGETE